jgi:hypothetical protein
LSFLPQEDPRLTVPREYLQAEMERMKSMVTGQFAELVFNRHEGGSPDWEDRKPRKVIPPWTVSPDHVSDRVSGRYRHLTVLACVGGGGDAPAPIILTSFLIRDVIWLIELGENDNFMIRFRNRGWMTTGLFHDHLSTVFIPSILQAGENPVFADQLCVLMTDSVGLHVSERNSRMLGRTRSSLLFSLCILLLYCRLLTLSSLVQESITRSI